MPMTREEEEAALREAAYDFTGETLRALPGPARNVLQHQLVRWCWRPGDVGSAFARLDAARSTYALGGVDALYQLVGLESLLHRREPPK